MFTKKPFETVWIWQQLAVLWQENYSNWKQCLVVPVEIGTGISQPGRSAGPIGGKSFCLWKFALRNPGYPMTSFCRHEKLPLLSLKWMTDLGALLQSQAAQGWFPPTGMATLVLGLCGRWIWLFFYWPGPCMFDMCTAVKIGAWIITKGKLNWY